MRTLILITILFFAMFTLSTLSQDVSMKRQNAAILPTGTATPEKVESGTLKAESLDTSGIPVTAYKVIEPTRLLKDPTQNIVCAYFVANWGESAWKGTKTNPFSYQALARKRGLRGKWVCDISDNLKEVNGR